jgi:hypothetical protein
MNRNPVVEQMLVGRAAPSAPLNVKHIEQSAHCGQRALPGICSVNRMNHSPFRLHRSESGVALVLTISVVALVAILMLTFAVTMRVEHTAVKNYNDSLQSRILARGAVDHAIAIIRGATPVMTNAPLTTYITTPGKIYTFTNNQWYSAELFTTDGANNQDLNQGGWITGTGTVYAATTPLSVGWTNIVSPDNVLIGRIAYWVDDESAKVNVNEAKPRGTDPDAFTPAAIDLDDISLAAVAASAPYPTVESVKAVVSEPQYSANRFFTTANSSSPDLTLWGAKRVNVTTNNFAGGAASVDLIANALSHTNLVGFYGQTFSNKYPNIKQIAANIIDYMDPDTTNCTDSGSAIDASDPTYLGLERTPYLNELVISNIINITTNSLGDLAITNTTITTIELRYLYSPAWNPPTNTEVYLMNRPGLTVNGNAINFTPAATIPAAGAIPANPSNNDGQYWTNSITEPPVGVGSGAASNITVILNAGTVTAIYRHPGSRMDFAKIPMTNYTMTAAIGAIPFTTNISWKTACNDPRVKPVSNNWNPLGGDTVQASGSLGQGNDIVRYGTNTMVNGVPIQGDGTFSCHTYSQRDRGNMYRSELAFIHTGVPWRTFWLQPQPASEGGPPPNPTIPDWAVLDLFSGTDETNVPGRININAAISNPGAALPQRLRPLFCLLTNSVSGATYNESIAVNNILAHNNPTNAFVSIGELCEVTGMVDTNLNDKLLRETAVRTAINNVTTRSDTFTVWAIAQSISDLNRNGNFDSGLDIVTGETKVQSIVERYENTSFPAMTNGVPHPGRIRFRVLYYRYYTD